MSEKASEKILIALSGGIESLVTAWLLKKQGKQLRGVYFDFFNDEARLETIKLFERKLGIPIQVVNGQEEIDTLMRETVLSHIMGGKKISFKETFHQKYLFPKLFQLLKQYGYQKVATGHRVLLQADHLHKLVRVQRYPEAARDECELLIGLEQEQISVMELPLGSIPSSMIEKIANELNVSAETAPFEINWADLQALYRRNMKIDQSKMMDAYNDEGARVGTIADFTQFTVGDKYIEPSELKKVYTIWTVDTLNNRALLGEMSRRAIRELHLQDASWFTLDDLKLECIRCSMSWNRQNKPVAVRVIQFEGGRLKVLLDTPLTGEDASIFNGQNVLWVNENEVLGGATVMTCK